jgi:hypothetical protein
MITALPANSAGITGQKKLWNGKFHGLITPITPSGMYSTRADLCGSSPDARRSRPQVVLAVRDRVAQLLADRKDLAHRRVDHRLPRVPHRQS